MAVLPTKFSISQQPSGRSGRVIAEYDTSAIGRGLSQLGAGISNLGADIRAEQTVQEGIAADGSALREMNDFVRSFDEDGDYGTFSKRANDGLKSIGEKYASKISDPRARERWLADYNQKAEGKRNQIADLGERKVRERRLVDAKSGLEGYQSLIADTNLSEDERNGAKRNAEASIAALEQGGLLSPSEAQQWRENVISGGDFVYAQREIERRGSAALTGGSVIDRIIGVESGGNPNAKNPKSSATGAGQFIDSTWLATVKSHRPDLMEGRTTAEVLALRNDGALSREMTQYLANDNADFLRNQGIAPTDGDIYLAHFLGPRGAAQVIKADPTSSIASIVGQDVVNANPFLNGMSAADVRAWSGRKMGGRPEWYTNQTPENQRKLEQLAQSRDNELITQRTAQQKVMQQQANDDYRLRISVNDPTLTQQDILNDTRLDNGDKATLINTFNQEADTNAGVQAIIGAISSGQSVAVNSFDANESKIAEKAYQRYVGSVGDEQRALASDGFIRSTGYIPKSLEADIRAGATSSNPEAMATTMQTAINLSKLAPVGFSAMTGVDDLRKKMDLYESYTHTMGLNPQQAAEKVIASNDPEQQRRRDAILKSEPVKKLLKDTGSNDVAAIFDKGIFSRSPDVGGGVTEDQIQVGVNPISEAAIVADYKRILEDAIVEADGDQTVAKDVASRRFQTVYGTTGFSPLSSNVVVRYPPEKAYPAGPDGSHEWIRQQAIEALGGEGIKATDIYLAPLPDGGTEKDISAGKPARYQIFYTDPERGTLESLNLPFYADPQVMRQQFEQQKLDIRRKSEEQMLRNRETAIEDAQNPTTGRTGQPMAKPPIGITTDRERFDRQFEGAGLSKEPRGVTPGELLDGLSGVGGAIGNIFGPQKSNAPSRAAPRKN